MSNEKHLREEIERLNNEVRRLEEEKEAQGHENKKAMLEANTKLDFQTKRADQYLQKYKSVLQYKNQEQSLKELDQQLREKENEIISLMTLDHQKSQEIQSLLQQTDQLKKSNTHLTNELSQIKEAAFNLIANKDDQINKLVAELDEYNNSENINNLKALIAEMHQKGIEYEDKIEQNQARFLAEIQNKDDEINQLQEKIAKLKEKNDDTVAKLGQEIHDLEKHIEDIMAQRDSDQNFEEKYYVTEEKLRKAEKKMSDFEQKYLEERNQFIQAINHLEQDKENMKNEGGHLKEARTKAAHFEKLAQTIKKQLEQSKEKYEEITKKLTHLENQKKIINENLSIKAQEIERLKAELQSKEKSQEPSLAKKESSSAQKTPQKNASEDQSGLIQKLKKQNKDLEQNNELLKKKVAEQTKELQESRQKLIQAKTADGHTEVNQLKVQMQELTSYLKKVECDMLMKKITHAEDENFWSIKEKKYKQQIEMMNKKFKKENSELLQRIDRMKRLIPKDKKTDYYQSGFK